MKIFFHENNVLYGGKVSILNSSQIQFEGTGRSLTDIYIYIKRVGFLLLDNSDDGGVYAGCDKNGLI